MLITNRSIVNIFSSRFYFHKFWVYLILRRQSYKKYNWFLLLYLRGLAHLSASFIHHVKPAFLENYHTGRKESLERNKASLCTSFFNWRSRKIIKWENRRQLALERNLFFLAASREHVFPGRDANRKYEFYCCWRRKIMFCPRS